VGESVTLALAVYRTLALPLGAMPPSDGPASASIDWLALPLGVGATIATVPAPVLTMDCAIVSPWIQRLSSTVTTMRA